MNPHAEARLEKVKRTSRGARRACLWLMGLVGLIAAVTLAGMLTLPGMTCEVAGGRAPCSELAPAAMTFAFVELIASVAIALAGVYRLAQLFGNYSRGEIFTRGSVRELRMLGYVVVAYVIFRVVLFVALLSLVAGGADGWPQDLHVDLPIGHAVAAALIMLLSWIMDVGAELREESELTV
jgi:hypothetical protein